MRILIANEAIAGAGGVETYLAAIIPALAARGHEIGVLSQNSSREQGPTRIVPAGGWTVSVADAGEDQALARVAAWRPDVAFSHNMGALTIDERLLAAGPVAKMMHGYFGTCISGQKAVGNGDPRPCARVFGAACLAQYFPRRCGQRRPVHFVRQYRWATRQRALLTRYGGIVVASDHMRAEYSRHGVAANRLHAIPLFAPPVRGARAAAPETDVLFLGRMTRIKGARVVIQAVAAAARALGRPVHLTMAGEGPQDGALRRLAADLGVPVTFSGWVSGDTCSDLLRSARVLAVPSRWPEPFGLVGLEAAAHGVPSVAFDVGGISEWLHDGVSGRLVVEAAGAGGFGLALAELLRDDDLRERLSSGARRVAAAMTLDAHMNALDAVLGEVARRKP